ncbi:ABC transporter permease [Cesiribacter andamanensis]|uniref:Lipoprotein-releasing system transmembrane protein lolE n=1 Tax=Cesiribacter andamanensis AMV16 TaxID=1279009 RepID=M7NC61_9BACT|nr:FtsX-like permease family protein [Cesiribacter andamanensis]EMR04827.1 Lipoprotein-releasing system transmembrane protein lolE [Cesiribacter andamanensis AMV16]
MNLPYFISNRIHKASSRSFSAVIHNIAVASIGLGLAVMIVSFLILRGFQQTITDKVVSFSGHLQVTRYSFGNMYAENPISTNFDFYQQPENYPLLEHVQPVAYKPGLLKTQDEVLGVLLKGVDERYHWERFRPNMLEGSIPASSDTAPSTEVIISQNIADQLRLSVGQDVIMYFVQNPPRFRRLTVAGIYSTGMEDFDQSLIMGDIRLVRQLNNWTDTLAGGFEVFLKDFNTLDQAQEELFELTNWGYFVEKVTDRNIQIFEWLNLLNKNVVIFLGLILFVACFNMVSILLILIMERTPMIGTLMALGATHGQLRRIFITNGMLLVLKGMLWGNIIALGFGVIQQQFKLIPLDKENYYMDTVPILWDWPMIIGLNLLIFVLVMLILLIPSAIISRIQPIKAIKFD